MSSVFEILEERGFIDAVTDEGLRENLAENKVTLYAGFDPTSDSLQIGNLLPVMALAHFQRAGHRVIMLVGGATGMVGDPSGKSEERNLLTPDDVLHNAEIARKQLANFLDFDGDNPACMVNNYDWTSKMSFIDWLRDVGKHFNVNQMLAKDSVKSRLGTENGISYTEFSYMTMQANDFKHLCEHEGCTLQVGGSDQWGNIVAGIELGRKALGKQLYGITFPLITTSTGEKLGKSAGNSVWLSAEKTSPYKFYQYWINTDDKDVGPFLKYFTFLALDEIAAIVAEHEAEPHRRLGQKRLAAEMTKLVHGEAGLASAEKATQVLFGGDLDGLSDAELIDIFADVPSTTLMKSALEAGIGLIDLLAETSVCKSKGEARRLIQGGGANINNKKETDIERVIGTADLASETCLLIRQGKKNYHLVRFE
jgi:tyrosyl-tRNA synthetase